MKALLLLISRPFRTFIAWREAHEWRGTLGSRLSYFDVWYACYLADLWFLGKLTDEQIDALLELHNQKQVAR